MTHHKRFLAAAAAALENLFGDVSVPPEKTIESLLSLVDNIEMKVKSIKRDLSAGEEAIPSSRRLRRKS